MSNQLTINQTIWKNIEDNDEEEYMIQQSVFQKKIYIYIYMNDEPI